MGRVVYKYGTGQPIPDGAVYLCTKTETVTNFVVEYGVTKQAMTTNALVWHYFLVEVEDGK